jgi:hypothetical protein
MEIAPISGIRLVTPVKTAARGLRPPAIFEIDGVAKAGDDAGKKNSRKAAGTEEDEDEELLLADDEEEAHSFKAESSSFDDAPASKVDYFA